MALTLIPAEMPQAWDAWTLCLISANLPDLDFFPGLLAGHPRACHRGPSHSLVAGLIAAGLGASLMAWSPLLWLTWALLIFTAYGSHVILDYFTPGRGVLLNWPFSHRRYRAVRPWFLSVTLWKTRQDRWKIGAGRHLLWAIGREVLLLGPAVVVLAIVRGLGWLPLSIVPF